MPSRRDGERERSLSRQEIRQRVQELVNDYRARTGQPELSTRKLAEAMRAEGVHITHGTLQNMLNGATNPDRATLRGLCRFFGVSEYYFDTSPRSAEIMGRIGKLDDQGLTAIEQLLTDLDNQR
jgi:transcriptional regulator with XRE-family HTH domain